MKLRHGPALAVIAVVLCVPARTAQNEQPATPPKGMMMLTIFLCHDQSKTLDEINATPSKPASTKTSRPPVSKWSPGT